MMLYVIQCSLCTRCA